MLNSVDQCVHRAVKQSSDTFNICGMIYDGVFEHILDKLGTFNIFAEKASLIHNWPCDDWPNNLTLFDQSLSGAVNVGLDLLLINNRSIQASVGEAVSHMLHCPMIVVDHELPNHNTAPKLRKYANTQAPDALYVSPHHIISEEWFYLESGLRHANIPYGFPEVEYNEDKSTNVLVVGDYASVDYELVDKMMKTSSNIKGLGNNQLTEPYENFANVEYNMNDSMVCITAAPSHRPPLLAMLAASYGCAVVTNKTLWTTSIFTDEENVILFNGIDDMYSKAKTLARDPKKAKELGLAGQQVIREKFNVDVARRGWLAAVNELKNQAYVIK